MKFASYDLGTNIVILGLLGIRCTFKFIRDQKEVNSYAFLYIAMQSSIPMQLLS